METSVQDYEMAAFHYNRAVALESQGRFGDAVEAYTLATRLDSKDAEAHVRLGLLLIEMARPDEGRQALKTAMQLTQDPGGSRGSGKVW